MKAIIAQKKNYNNEQKRKRQKKSKEMNSKTLLGGIEGNVGNEMNNIDLVMASNTQVSYVLTVMTYKKGELKKTQH
jgi:hypothetical protein